MLREIEMIHQLGFIAFNHQGFGWYRLVTEAVPFHFCPSLQSKKWIIVFSHQLYYSFFRLSRIIRDSYDADQEMHLLIQGCELFPGGLLMQLYKQLNRYLQSLVGIIRLITYVSLITQHQITLKK
jgi:hypothetical protein